MIISDQLMCQNGRFSKIQLHVMHISYSTIVLYSRDHQGFGRGPQKNIIQKPASFLSHDDVAVLVR